MRIGESDASTLVLDVVRTVPDRLSDVVRQIPSLMCLGYIYTWIVVLAISDCQYLPS